MATDFLRGFLVERRKRMVGGIMHFAESSPWWGRLSREEQKAYRDKVLESTGAYHDAVLDALKAAVGDGIIVNEEAIRLIQNVHDRVVRLDRRGD